MESLNWKKSLRDLRSLFFIIFMHSYIYFCLTWTGASGLVTVQCEVCSTLCDHTIILDLAIFRSDTWNDNSTNGEDDDTTVMKIFCLNAASHLTGKSVVEMIIIVTVNNCVRISTIFRFCFMLWYCLVYVPMMDVVMSLPSRLLPSTDRGREEACCDVPHNIRPSGLLCGLALPGW